PRSSRSAVSAPRSAGCSQARELMPVNTTRLLARGTTPTSLAPAPSASPLPSVLLSAASVIAPRPFVGQSPPIVSHFGKVVHSHELRRRVVRRGGGAGHQQVDVGRGGVGREVRALPPLPPLKVGPQRLTVPT